MGQSYKMGEITLLLAGRFPLFSSGLQHLLLAEKGIMRVDVADGRKEVMQYLQVFRYDILLMDTRLPDSESLEILQQIKSFYPFQKVIFIGRMRDSSYLRECIQLGLKGFLLRSSSLEEVLHALKLVYNGTEYFTPEVAQTIYQLAANPNFIELDAKSLLIQREKEVLRRICEEKCNEEIASELNISLSMVKKYRSSLLSKTGAKNSAGLVLFALREGFVRIK
jgi:DNA-binding NarL/FixJ family response regulator